MSWHICFLIILKTVDISKSLSHNDPKLYIPYSSFLLKHFLLTCINLDCIESLISWNIFYNSTGYRIVQYHVYHTTMDPFNWYIYQGDPLTRTVSYWWFQLLTFLLGFFFFFLFPYSNHNQMLFILLGFFLLFVFL